MKLVKIVKLQRVRLGSLDGGDMCTPDLDRGWRATAHKALRNGCGAYDIVLAMDKKKYPPEVTYNIEGMTSEGEDPDVYVDSLGGGSATWFIPLRRIRNRNEVHLMKSSDYPHPFKIVKTADGMFRLYRKMFGVWWRMSTHRGHSWHETYTFWEADNRQTCEVRISEVIDRWKHRNRNRRPVREYHVEIKVK